MPLLSESEIQHFVREGYLVRRAQISRTTCAQALECLWQAGSKPRSIQRQDPSTHVWLPAAGRLSTVSVVSLCVTLLSAPPYE
jgi:hypothetical protein